MLFVICFAIVWIFIRPLFPTKVVGKENLPKKKGYVLTCNHFSNMDCIILDLFLVKKIRFLAKKELFKNKFASFFLKKFGAYPINREKPELSSFRFALDVLKKDKILGIFPEGTRNKTEKAMQDLKQGAITFASKGNTDIVPVVLYNKPKAFRKNYIIIGEPIKIEGENPSKLTKEEIELNAQKLYNVMQDLRKGMDEKLASKRKGKNKNVKEK